MLIRFVPEQIENFKREKRNGLHCEATVRDKALAILSKGVPYSYEAIVDMINVDEVYPNTTVTELKSICKPLIVQGLLYEIEQKN